MWFNLLLWKTKKEVLWYIAEYRIFGIIEIQKSLLEPLENKEFHLRAILKAKKIWVINSEPLAFCMKTKLRKNNFCVEMLNKLNESEKILIFY